MKQLDLNAHENALRSAEAVHNEDVLPPGYQPKAPREFYGDTRPCARGHEQNSQGGMKMETFDLVAHLCRQRAFSRATFGPGARTKGVLDHIRKELVEIEKAPGDITEWADLLLLSLDGAWRAGHSPAAIAQAIHDKQGKNELRDWPDWRTADPDKAIEHVRAAPAAIRSPLEIFNEMAFPAPANPSPANCPYIECPSPFVCARGCKSALGERAIDSKLAARVEPRVCPEALVSRPCVWPDCMCDVGGGP